MTWEPSESDIKWTKELLGVIEIGGVWYTSYGVYLRVSKKLIRLVARKQGVLEAGSLERTKKTILAAGYDYEERLER